MSVTQSAARGEPAGPRGDAALSLRLSVTSRCEFRCLYCVGAGGAACPAGPPLTARQFAAFVRRLQASYRLSKVHITGGEPLLREDILAVVRAVADTGVQNIALTTNGQLLARYAAPLQAAGIRRVNVSVDSLDPETYGAINCVGAHPDAARRGVEAAVAAGLDPVKINTVVLREYNLGEVTRLADWAFGLGCAIRFIELMPLQCVRQRFERLYVSSQEVRRRLSAEYELTPRQTSPGSSSRMYDACRAGQWRGRIGFISSVSQPFCSRCRRLRLTSDGRLLGCLRAPVGVSIRQMLSSPEAVGIRALGRLAEEMLRQKGRERSYSNVSTLVGRGG